MSTNQNWSDPSPRQEVIRSRLGFFVSRLKRRAMRIARTVNKKRGITENR